MNIIKIEIDNYRQFQKPTEILFSTEKEKHITIIQGDNGCGKSNIMNALTWCLYGEEMFRSKKNEGRPIINDESVHKLQNFETSSVTVSVTIGEKEPEYKFTRTQTYKKMGGAIKSVLDPEFSGFEITEKKGYRELSDPEWYVNHHFVPESLKNFFLFDGEKMNEYFEDTEKIGQYIEDLAQISTLNSTIDSLKKVLRAINAEIKNSKGFGNVDYMETTNLKIKITSAKNELNQIKERRMKIDAEIDEIDEFLKNNNNTTVKGLQQSRKQAEQLQAEYVNNKSEAEDKIKRLIADYIPIVFSYRALTYAKDEIEENTKKGVLPPAIKDVFLQDLLSRGTCICGRNLDDDPECRKKLEQLLTDVMPSAVAEDSINGRMVIADLLDKIDFTENLKKYRKIVNDCDTNINDIVKQLELISDKLKNVNIAEISSKEHRRQNLYEEKYNIAKEEKTQEDIIKNSEKAIKEREAANVEFQRQNEKARKIQSLRDYTEHIITNFENVKKTLVEEVRMQLEEKTRSSFFQLIWKDKEEFSDVSIIEKNGKFHISVKSRFGDECLGDISSGEKQALALSFTAALYVVSGNNVPIFIDTPMGRISGTTRDNMATFFPEYLPYAQLIILPTDTEYTPNVRQQLKPSVGKEYKLKFSNGKTEVTNYE